MKHELLAPAGDMDSLKQALAHGADAIYVGCENFGARKFAKNFTNEELIYAIRLCHLYGVRIYATMNTLVKDDEVVEFLKQIEFLYKNGIDAVLIQDFGMFNLCRGKYPNLEIHASTQANISSKDTCEFFNRLGAKRGVLSRELSLKEIKNINTNLEKEVFIHGALCSSYSGCCLMSSLVNDRSANKGECASCCRMLYSLQKNKQIIKKPQYLLSMKELNTSYKFKELLDSDIASFKIEGRMKSPNYVGFVTRLYRKLIDSNTQNINLDKENNSLKTLYNRGFTEGYLFEEKPEEIINTEHPNHIGLEIGKVVGVDKEKIKIRLDKELNQQDGIRFLKSGKGFIVNYLYDENMQLTNSVPGGSVCYVENKVELTINDKVCKTLDYKLNKDLENLPARQIPVTFTVTAFQGSPMVIEINDGTNLIKVQGAMVEAAQTMPLTEEKIREQVEKLGGTPFISTSTVVQINGSIYVDIKDINELRRNEVSQLMEVRMNAKKEAVINTISLPIINTQKETGISATAFTTDQADYISARSSLTRYYYTKESDYESRKINPAAYYKLPRCSRQPIEKAKNKTLINDYFDFTAKEKIIADYGMNVTNIYTAYYLYKYGADVITPSPELSSQEIVSLINNYINTFKVYPRVEVIAYGRIENMLIKGNILNIIANDYKYELVDEKDRHFPVYYDGVNTHVLNYEKIDLKNKDLLKDYVVLRYEFFDETTEQIKNLLNK